MLKYTPINLSRVEEMAEGDEVFKSELIFAIHTSLLDLKDKYLEGANTKNEETIQMIRHKVKPTLALFELEKLAATIASGKELLAENGFENGFASHLKQFQVEVDEALNEVQKYMLINKK